MPASKDSVEQLVELIDDLIYLDRNLDVWPARLRMITGNSSLTVTCEAVATALEKKWGLTA